MSKIGDMRQILRALLEEHDRDGALPTSGRFLYYELVARGQVAKADKDGARYVTAALTDIREDGTVPWNWIVDETRSLEDYTGYDTVREGVLASIQHVKLDPWDGEAPLILTESRSLAGVLRRTANTYRVRIASTNGQCGGFLHTNIAPLLDDANRVIYLGDYDLAGDQIEANTRRVIEDIIDGSLEWERLALTAEQVEEYDLPVITKYDRRYNDNRPHEAVETEALKQTVLVDILTARLTELLPEPLEAVHEREAREQRAVTAILRRAR